MPWPPQSLACPVAGQPFGERDVPDGYYDTATGSGSLLQTQLYNTIRSPHWQQSYGGFRDSARSYDNLNLPFSPDTILLAYSRQVVDGTWDSGRTWNREHVWPVSRQPGSSSNGTTGMLGDPFVLRPSDPRVNSNRGNLPFGGGTTSSDFGREGEFYFPGHPDKGDVARALFYAETRYGPETGVRLVNGQPTGNEMGDLASLIRWHYEDGVDVFEDTRNRRIAFNTRNRNPFIDNPGYVWSIYVDQQNDSRLTLEGAAIDTQGGSRTVIDYGRFLPSADLVIDEVFQLNKTRQDGTHFQLEADASLDIQVLGGDQAFAIGEQGSVDIRVRNRSGPFSEVGQSRAVVRIDNLDVTTGFGVGHGGQDGDDVIELLFERVDHARPSLLAIDQLTQLTLDFGDIDQFALVDALDFSIYNDANGFAADFIAALDLDGIIGSGDTDVLTTDLALFEGLEAGDAASFQAMVSTSEAGRYEALYTLMTSDEDLPGNERTTALSLRLRANVLAADVIPEPTITLVITMAVPLLTRRRCRVSG